MKDLAKATIAVTVMVLTYLGIESVVKQIHATNCDGCAWHYCSAR